MSFPCPLKEIVYRGGVVRFHIPKHWNEEYEKDGGGTFYETGDDTGTLRINVLSFLNKEDVLPESLLALNRKRSTENNGQVEVLPNDRFLLKYAIQVKENGEDLVIYRWEVAKMVSPRDCNIAAFSFAITAAQSKSIFFLQEVSSIEEEIRKVSFWIHGDTYES